MPGSGVSYGGARRPRVAIRGARCPRSRTCGPSAGAAYARPGGRRRAILRWPVAAHLWLPGVASDPRRGGVGDRRPARGGARAVGDLASSIGAHADALSRLLRALAAVEVLREEPDGSFALTDLGEALRGPAGSLAAFIGRPNHWTAWGQLTAQRPHRRERLPRGPRCGRVGVPRTPPRGGSDLRRRDDRVLAPRQRGGGRGARLRPLRRDRRRRRRPRRAAGRDPRSALRGCAACCSTSRPSSPAPTPRGSRSSAAASSSPFPAGGDAYLLKSVLHDWQDEPAIEILRTRRRAAGNRHGAARHRAPVRPPCHEALGPQHARRSRRTRASCRGVRGAAGGGRL